MPTAPNPYPIHPAFSFRWVNENPTIDARYNGEPIDSLIDDRNYAHPWQINDKAQIQYINIYEPVCKLYTCDDIFVKDIIMSPIDPPIIDTDLICYNGEVSFADVNPGRYYCKLTYTDADEIVQDWCTSPLDVESDHPGTLLYEVNNLTNKMGAIFIKSDGSPLVINCRVHGMLRSPIPKSDSEDYEDQYDDLTQLSSIPSENWTNLIGNSADNVTNFFQIPWWVIQKFNLLYSLDKVLINGQQFTKVSGAEFKPFRVENQRNEDAYWAIDLQPNSNYANEQYVTGDTPAQGEYVVVYKFLPYNNVGADFSISGKFTADMNLIKVLLMNNGLDAFTLKIGKTPGGNEIKEFDIKANVIPNPLIVEYLFTENTTVYFSGLNGTSCNLRVVYDDFLATNVEPPENVSSLIPNIPYPYIEFADGDFSRDWNISTGLGNAGTAFEGCAMCDGRNGTKNLQKSILKHLDLTNPTLRGTFAGADKKAITRDNLPAEGIEIFANEANNTPGDKPGPNQTMAITGNSGGLGYEIHKASGDATIGLSADLGSGEIFDVTNYSYITFFFVKLPS